MANCSDVSGEIFCDAGTAEKSKEVLELIQKITNHWPCYNFDLDNEPEAISDSSASSTFYATGRWTFQRNVQNFGNWLYTTEEEDAQEAIKKLTAIPFSLTFTYDEDEPGCGFVGEGEAELRHKANTPLKDIELISDNYECHDLTVENLVNVRGFEEDYAEHYLANDEEEEE